jgi:hypothetical protein
MYKFTSSLSQVALDATTSRAGMLARAATPRANASSVVIDRVKPTIITAAALRSRVTHDERLHVALRSSQHEPELLRQRLT